MTSHFRFRKSWGAELIDGGARFRLWAPSQETVALRVADTGADIPMQSVGDGWFQLDTDDVPVGGGYSYVMADGLAVNDPAARAQVAGVDGPSRLIDPAAYTWQTPNWRGRRWEETVFYELHTGTFTEEGDFDGVRRRLDHLVDVGVTAVELLPVAQFGGNRGWGYDGVLLYAPHVVYGGPEGLKRLVDAAHERGLMMFLDVVYNHFGPDGNYLAAYAPEFFHPENHTPWGAAIAYEKRPVRDFFIENALYWLEEYRFDGLRLDAIDQIAGQTDEPVLEEIAEAVRSGITDREVHLTTEDDRNVTELHVRDAEGRPKLYSGEWNDDIHHAFHTIATGERDVYYADFADDPVGQIARALATGFIFQGEPSPYRNGKIRGTPSAHMPPLAFVNFMQNHDQVGNRAYSERLSQLGQWDCVDALTAILLLSPQIPLLFMGEEYGETNPFGFFTDFHGELADAVREGRMREFAAWPHFASPDHSAQISDPNDEGTFLQSQLDWHKLKHPGHRDRLAFVRSLLTARLERISPVLPRIGGDAGSFDRFGQHAAVVRWQLAGGGQMALYFNVGEDAVDVPAPSQPDVIFAHNDPDARALGEGKLMPDAVISILQPAAASPA